MRSCWRDLDAVDLCVVLDGDELDGDRAGAAGGGGERFGHGLVLPACGGEDVEVGQDLGAVDEDVEGAIPGRGPVCLGEVESYRVAGAGGEAGDGVGEVAVAVVLVDRLGCRVGDAGGGDGVGGGRGRAAGVILVGYERRGGRAAGRDISAAAPGAAAGGVHLELPQG